MGKKNLIAIVLLAIVMGVLPMAFKSDYAYGLTALFFLGVYCLITIGLSLLMGYAGQISIGHAAFYGIGAYTSGLLTTRLGMNPWLAMVAAVLIGGLFALIIGIPALRLRGHYLAMATLAFGVIVYIFFDAQVNLTGGPSGFGSIPNLKVFGQKINTDRKAYYLVWSFVILALGLTLNFVNSRSGRALRSIHGSEVAARAMGVNVSKLKVQVFVVSACLASLAGSIYAHYMTFVSPSPFEVKFSITLVTMVAVGGMTNLWGAMAGTAFLHLLAEYLRGFDNYYLIIYGGILIVVMIFVPQGLLVGLFQGIDKVILRLRGKKEARR